MGLASLDAALSGLRVTHQQISVIANNIANAGTPGYTRKILPQSTQTIAGVAVGVFAEKIIRRVDLNLERDLWTQVSTVASLDIRQSYLARIDKFHGPPDKELSVAAEIGRLRDSFATLADSPEDSFRQAGVVNQALDTARKINDLSNLITTSRNDAQDEIQTTVDRINDLLEQIANANDEIKSSIATGRTSAGLEDQRDNAIKELSGLIEISFFQRGDGVLVIQTNEGVELAANTAKTLTFSPSRLSALTFYPDSAAGVYVGDPLDDPGAVDITARSPGGKLGGLIQLRDEIFPKQMAQLDELAHKMAMRFNEQGLRLFTDASGGIPADTAPDPTTLPDPTPVEYVGFSAVIRVNDAIVLDHTLLQNGTYGATVSPGSDEVIRRIVNFTFTDVDYQQAIGDTDLRVSANAPPNNTLQNFLGIHSQNDVDGTRDLSAFTSPAAFIAAANGALGPTSDTMRFTFQDTNLGLGPINVDLDLSAVADGAGNFLQDIVTHINGTVIPALPALDQAALTTMGVVFSAGSNGQLSIDSRASITVDGTNPANPMGATGLGFMGFSAGTYTATDPYFDVQVGNKAPVRITIDSNDDENDLLAQLNAVPGLGVEDLTVSADGFLRLRPGGSYTNPDFGGDIKIISGPYTASSAGANAVFGAGTILDGVNIVSALFGSFTNPPLQDHSPVTDVDYQSVTDGSLVTPQSLAFRVSLLGPNADISTEVVGAGNLIEYSQKVVNQHAQELILAQSHQGDAESLRDTLQTQLQDTSGVNIDEELGNLVVMQTAYAAAARVINAINDLFDDLLAAVG
ncbi:MAG: flagellar hook-associated protein FlgK [Alphaproteobacteria bacterium]|nr:flagellar hook-associated protein FlgK [Alphaproteobacteria bacterium]